MGARHMRALEWAVLQRRMRGAVGELNAAGHVGRSPHGGANAVSN